MRLDGLYGLYHFLFLLVMVLIGSATIYIFYAKLKNPRQQALALKIIAGIWLIFGIVHQVMIVYESVEINHAPGMTWAMLLPYTYCGLLSIVTPLVIILFKRDNIALHCLTYFCFFGGFSVFFAPWLNNTPFYMPSSILAMIHHAFMFGVSILLIITKYVRPTMKRFYAYPVGVALVILLGVFEKYVLNFSSGMMIGEPLLKSIPHLTSWWGLWICGSFLVFVFLFFYEFIVYKKDAREIFDVHELFDELPFKKKKNTKKK